MPGVINNIVLYTSSPHNIYKVINMLWSIEEFKHEVRHYWNLLL